MRKFRHENSRKANDNGIRQHLHEQAFSAMNFRNSSFFPQFIDDRLRATLSISRWILKADTHKLARDTL
jgi:hypothetical protein